MDSTFSELHEKNTGVHLLVVQVLELWLIHLRELNKERMDFNLNLNSFGDDCQKS